MHKVPIFYTTKMVADSESFSPSAKKPKQVVASWQKHFNNNIEIIEPVPVSIDDYARAHDRSWAKDILDGKQANGFGNKSLGVAASLPYTSGSMLSAARSAFATKKAACAPCSGFHHAGYRSAQGFCTFNGLMVTALALKADGVNQVGILDLDMHYGNGTDDIIYKMDCRTWITHYTAGSEYTRPIQSFDFLAIKLPDVLDAMKECDIVLYQAGADPHIDDPYGGWLTTEQLRMRDAMVFSTLAKANVPVAWNLAGGYQIEKDGSIPKVLEVHDNTMRECIEAWCKHE